MELAEALEAAKVPKTVQAIKIRSPIHSCALLMVFQHPCVVNSGSEATLEVPHEA